MYLRLLLFWETMKTEQYFLLVAGEKRFDVSPSFRETL